MARRKQESDAAGDRDEADAEVRYQKALSDAREAAEELAADGETESRRLAAAETARALQAIEDARVAAETVDATVVKKTFADKVFEFLKI